ncbi:hypothetical protein F4827_005128 [Paraburkholderia bannensis]|uniref:DUF2946 domain-containing protein n=1 Tax=Paraburkholderia bannensis TaxID=765414 RepID=A0A7W9U1D6_9BURK|nr:MULTISPECIES: DUF2946 domain-containing protein [Paraburkholderia]MBB3260056.1 hypothetical protein [Paraburkholderia sp. WP4_3_2]MBB6105262.1 hypothetical protein [Paraburkholderia bannensis]
MLHGIIRSSLPPFFLYTVRRIHLRLVSLLGTLAILMTTLAPVISHLLAVQATPSAQPLMMSAHCDMPSMRHLHGMDGANGAHGHAQAPNADLQDCGYCNLLAHLPVMPGVLLSLALATRLVHARVAARFKRLARVEPLTFALARAPPLV